MSRVLDTLKGVLPPVDSRSSRDVESDIDDEIAFHLEMKTRDLIGAGAEPTAARAVAHEQFGDIQTIKTKCKRIALKERIMLQRVNFVLMIIVVGLVLALSYQIWMTQKKTSDALSVITSEIAHVRSVDARAMSAAAAPTGLIYMNGIVVRPGAYNLPQYGNLTLKRLIATAGGLTGASTARVTVSQIDHQGKAVVRFTSDRLFDDPQTDYVLVPNDHVLVESITSAAGLPAALRTGEWRQISDNGEIDDQGAKLLLLSEADPRNSSGVSSAVAQLTPGEGELGLMFREDGERNLILNERVDGGRRTTRCRWWYEGKDILLDLSRARPSMTSPVRIRWIDAADDKIDEFVSATGVLPGMQPRDTGDAGNYLAQSKLSAEEQRLRAETLSRFLQHVLTSANPGQEPGVGGNVRELLDHASKQVETDFANDPQKQIMFRQWIAQANARLAEQEQAEQQKTRERENDDDAMRDQLKRSPFELVAWDDWAPYVRLSNKWWRLQSINGVKADDIINHCKKVHRDRERKRFSEDLVQVMGEMGHRLGDTAKLELRDVKTDAITTIDAAPVTKGNRTQIWELNAASEQRWPGGFPKFDPVTATGPHPAPPRENDAPANQPLSANDVQRDVDQLRRHLLDQFSYLKLNNVNLDAAIDALKAELNGPVSREALGLKVHKLICQFGDGHAGVSGLERMLPSGYTPFLIGDADGRLVAFREDRAALIDPDHPYIRTIDGQPINQWLERASVITARGSPQLQSSRAVRHLRLINFLRAEAGLPEKPTVDVELTSGDGASVRTLSLPIAQDKPMYGEWPRTESKLLDNNIGYLRVASMDDAAAVHIIKMMREFRNSNGLIIDVRGNGGGSRTALQVLFPYFIPTDSEPVVANVAAYRLSESFPPDHLAARDLYPASDSRWTDRQRQAIERIAKTFKPQWQPPNNEFSAWHYFVLDRPPHEDSERYHYDRPVVILMNEACFSATDIFLGAFKTAGFANVKLLGTPSGGGSGRKQAVRLNNSGIVIELSSMISFLPSGEMYDRAGIQPDVIVNPVATDFIGETDSALDAAIKSIPNRK